MHQQTHSFLELPRRAPWVLSAVLASLAFLLTPLSGQAVSATLLGNVTDTAGAAVPNAPVASPHRSPPASLTPGLPMRAETLPSRTSSGTYTVTVTASGFKKETRENIAVITNTTTRVDLTLAAGSATRPSPSLCATAPADGPSRYLDQHRATSDRQPSAKQR